MAAVDRREERRQVNAIEVKWGSVAVKEFSTILPASNRTAGARLMRSKAIRSDKAEPEQSSERRSEGARTVKNGNAQTRWVQGIGTNTCSEIQRNPLAFTKWPLLDRTGSR